MDGQASGNYHVLERNSRAFTSELFNDFVNGQGFGYDKAGTFDLRLLIAPGFCKGNKI